MTLKSFSLRHALSVGVAVFVAVICHHYFSFSREGWIILAALLVSQTTRGTPLRQAIIYLLNIVLALFLSAFLLMSMKNAQLIFGFCAILFFIVGCVVFITRPETNKMLYLSLLCLLAFLIAVFLPVNAATFLQDRLVDSLLGALIAVVCAQIVFPVRTDVEFSQGVIPILQALATYTQTLAANVTSVHQAQLNQQKSQVEIILQAQQETYPEWVYEVGFNPGLRAGFRYFLVHIERIMEILFSLHYLILQPFDRTTTQALLMQLATTMEKNQELLVILLEYFQYKKITPFTTDFTSDIAQLERALQAIVPDNLEFMDISEHSLTLAALVRDSKDLRELLLQLVTALPTVPVAG